MRQRSVSAFTLCFIFALVSLQEPWCVSGAFTAEEQRERRKRREFRSDSASSLLPLLLCGESPTHHRSLALALGFPTADSAREADQLFSRGQDPARDRQSLAVLERAIAADPNNYQLLWRAARSYYYVGDAAAGKQEKKVNFEKGIFAAQRAVAQQGGAVEGHFWLAANYGGWAEMVGVVNAYQTVKKIRAEMQTVLRINANYEDGNAYLALGLIDRELPRLLGGNAKRGVSYLEQGLRAAPQNLDLKLALAKAYIEDGRKDEGRRLLQEVVNAPINPARAKESRHNQEKARQLLSRS
jgi:FimV-like protein